MSRANASGISQTAEANSSADQSTATNALTAEQGDIGNYEAQLAKYAANNPFARGGEYDTATDSKLSGVADVGSAAIQNQLATQAKRTGENASAATATAAEVARQNERDLAAGEAGATQSRIGDEAGYNQGVLGATAAPVGMEAGIANPTLGAAEGSLNTATAANSQDRSFWDDFGEAFATAQGKGLGTPPSGGGN